MEVTIGATYSSPFHGQYIKVIDVLHESDYEYIFVVDFLEKDGTGRDPCQVLNVLPQDFNKWTMVKNV